MPSPRPGAPTPHGSGGLRRRLGQILLDFGWLRQEELDQALRTQRALGGRLGTCLLEIDAITEKQLEEALSELNQTPAAGQADLERLPTEIRETLSPKLANSIRAVPFRQVGDELWVAMLDPGDLNAQDEIAFAAGRRLRVHAASEVRIGEALSHHYGLRLDERLKQILAYLEVRRLAAAELASAGRPTPFLDEPLPKLPRTPLADAVERLSRAGDRKEIAEVLLRHLLATFDRVVLLKVLPRTVAGWAGGGPGVSDERVRQLELRLDQPSVFRELGRGAGMQIGPLPPLPPHQTLTACWEGSPGAKVVVLPIRVRGRLVAAVYLDRSSGGLTSNEMEELEILSLEAGTALERYLLRKKQRKA